MPTGNFKPGLRPSHNKFQSLLHQVSGANLEEAQTKFEAFAQFQSLLHQVSGANFFKVVAADPTLDVSIPSSSGQWCQPMDLASMLAKHKKFQSLLHQVSGANSEEGRPNDS